MSRDFYDLYHLTQCLHGAAPESSIRWLAGASLVKIGGPNAAAAIEALLQQDISDKSREEAQRTLNLISLDKN